MSARKQAKQGHRYTLDGQEVLALSNGPHPRISEILRDRPWPLGEPVVVDADELVPQPMAYFHGQVPV